LYRILSADWLEYHSGLESPLPETKYVNIDDPHPREANDHIAETDIHWISLCRSTVIVVFVSGRVEEEIDILFNIRCFSPFH
jgi:hypothetical protein